MTSASDELPSASMSAFVATVTDCVTLARLIGVREPVTTSVSETRPICSVMSRVTGPADPGSSTTSSANPWSVTRTATGTPMATGNSYRPFSAVVTAATGRPATTASTNAPGNTPPDASFTTPLTVALLWANRGVAATASATQTAPITRSNGQPSRGDTNEPSESSEFTREWSLRVPEVFRRFLTKNSGKSGVEVWLDYGFAFLLEVFLCVAYASRLLSF